MEQFLCEAAIMGSVESLHQIIAKDALILDKVVEGCFHGKSPLHVAVPRGHTQFVEELLRLKPEMAEVLDSERRSALHLATAKGHVGIVNALIKAYPQMRLVPDGDGRSVLHLATANGHVDIVKALINAYPEMCQVPDGDGRNPLHIAAIHGQIEVLEELVRRSSEAARARTNKDETILHLCVKHNQLQSLIPLIKRFSDEKFVNAKDNNGNTILHLAVFHKRLEIIQHLLKDDNIKVNVQNASGDTALDICLEGVTSDNIDEEIHFRIKDFLHGACAMRGKDILGGDWGKKKREALMVVSTLIATMAFQAGVNPPGGVWQDNSDGHRAGKAIIAYNYPDSYQYFINFNTIGFVSSLSVILLLISDLPSTSKAFVWLPALITWLTVMAVTFTYTYSIIVISPKEYKKSQARILAVIVWSIVISLFLLRRTIRVMAKTVKLLWNRNKATERRSVSLSRSVCFWRPLLGEV